MSCESTMDAMTDYILGRTIGKDVNRPDDEVVRHCMACPDCKKQLEILMRIAIGKDFHLSRPLICEDVLDRVPEMAELEEHQMMLRYPAEWLHTRTCEQCRTVLEMTVSCLIPEIETEFDRVHSFVETAPKKSGIVWESRAPHFQRLARQLTIMVSKGREALADIPDWLAGRQLIPEPVTSFRSREAEKQICCELVISCRQPERQLILRVTAVSPDSVHLKLKLADLSTNRTLDGVKVALLDGRGHFLVQVFTSKTGDDKGESWADFKNISRGQYTLKVTEKKETWEIPLNLE